MHSDFQSENQHSSDLGTFFVHLSEPRDTQERDQNSYLVDKGTISRAPGRN